MTDPFGLSHFMRTGRWKTLLAPSSTSREMVICGAFVVGLLLYETIILSPDLDRQNLIGLFSNGSIGKFGKSLAMSAMSLILVTFSIVVARRGRAFLKILFFIYFAIAIAVEYAHHAALDRYSHYSTAAVGIYGGDWTVGLNALALYFNPWCLPPMLGVLAMLTVGGKKPRRKNLFLPLISACLVFAALTAYFTSNAYGTISIWAFFRTTIGYPIIWQTGRGGADVYRAPSQVRQQLVPISKARPHNNVVFIVDESVRGDHLPLNGYRSNEIGALTELLSRGDLVNFGIASAGSTCSRSSNNLLLTGFHDLPDRQYKIYQLPTIFQFARAMGYMTFEFDGQTSGVWKGTFADLKSIDYRQTPVQLSANVQHDYEIDGEIGRQVRSIVTGSVGNFIWISKRGVHIPYPDAFPRRGGQLSAMELINYNRTIPQKEFVADYDAAIRFNLNLFFDQLLVKRHPAGDTFYVYTSDHGQSLREGGAVASHCSVTRPEAIVPLFVVGSGIGAQGWQTGYKASHANIFATLLDLMNVPAEARSYDYAVSVAKARQDQSTKRFYFDHDLSGEDGGKRYPFDR